MQQNYDAPYCPFEGDDFGRCRMGQCGLWCGNTCAICAIATELKALRTQFGTKLKGKGD